MKKVVLFLMGLMLSFSLIACGGEQKAAEEVAPAVEQKVEEVTPDTTVADTTVMEEAPSMEQ
ncbi:MAG: hypothetical protein AB7T22_04705 [Calditrichaceae bacterium]